MSRLEFPSRADVRDTTLDPQLVEEALARLRIEVAAERAEVYHPLGRALWNVWLAHSVIAGGRRVELEDWIRDWFPTLKEETR